jgi:hypothetical protein
MRQRERERERERVREREMERERKIEKKTNKMITQFFFYFSVLCIGKRFHQSQILCIRIEKQKIIETLFIKWMYKKIYKLKYAYS